eukprot:6195364-Amphidinium_carterae.1
MGKENVTTNKSRLSTNILLHGFSAQHAVGLASHTKNELLQAKGTAVAAKGLLATCLPWLRPFGPLIYAADV